MKVAMVLEPLWHRVPGGTGRYTACLAAALHTCDGIDLAGVAARHDGPPPPPWEPPGAVAHHRLPRPLLYELWTRTSFAPPDALVPGADVVHATSVVAPPARRPLVVTVHDLAFTDPHAGFDRRVRALFERGWRRTIERAAAVIAPSRTTADALIGGGLEPDRVHVVPEGVRPTELEPGAGAAVRATYGLDRPFVLSVATAEPRKNLPGVLAAFAAVAADRDVDLVLAGPAGWGPDLQRVVDASGAPAERVHPVGFVPDGLLPALYAEAELLCYPSWSEGFGLPVLEAMSIGTAVVTSSTTATAEVCGDAGVTVDPSDQRAVNDAVGRLLDDEAARIDLGERGRQRASLFTWEASAAGTVQVYRAALGR